jgi:hypothetical protein
MFGWGQGFVAEGFNVVGFDIVHEDFHGPVPDGCELVLQDVLTLDGSQFRDATVIVASPPCQAYSYRAMPWKRAKALPPPDNTLFEACFRIQREASEAAGRYVPMVVENVKGAQPWVGRATWHYGSFYLWGDVPALMPIAQRVQKFNPDGTSHGPGSWFAIADSKNRGAHSVGVKAPGLNWSDRSKLGQDFTRAAGAQATKNSGGSWFAVAHNTTSGKGQNPDGRRRDHQLWPLSEREKRAFHPMARSSGLKRKHASALIAKIPFTLARHIARVYKGCSSLC